MIAPAVDPIVDPIGAYLSDRMRLVVHSSPGPFTATRRPGGSVQLASPRRRDRPLATFAREADALLFVDVAADLRALIGVIVELIASHHADSRGQCLRCRQQTPCPTRRIIAAQLMARTGR
jgi:hypothetical protein